MIDPRDQRKLCQLAAIQIHLLVATFECFDPEEHCFRSNFYDGPMEPVTDIEHAHAITQTEFLEFAGKLHQLSLGRVEKALLLPMAMLAAGKITQSSALVV